ncbi:small ribosomal subunit protein uS10m isoform X1 [Anabrus simplex]|uniref:small ribosomal subunit protein uS10m isoform X1 n=1 Tax=Anabrus simplex TaxID=316456 RepID=UPI0034DD2B47
MNTVLSVVKSNPSRSSKWLAGILGNRQWTTSSVSCSLSSASVPQIVEETKEQKKELDKLYRLLEVEVRGNDPAVLKSYSWFATTAARELGIRVGECWAQRKPIHERMTLLKSVHIYKKHRVQYEVRTYFRFMQFHQLTGSTSDTFLEYIQRNLPEGVAMKVTKARLEPLPEHLMGKNQTMAV